MPVLVLATGTVPPSPESRLFLNVWNARFLWLCTFDFDVFDDIFVAVGMNNNCFHGAPLCIAGTVSEVRRAAWPGCLRRSYRLDSLIVVHTTRESCRLEKKALVRRSRRA